MLGLESILPFAFRGRLELSQKDKLSNETSLGLTSAFPIYLAAV